jgi:hypothetical protein
MSPNRAGMYSLSTILLALGTATVLARIRVRMLQRAKLQMDDWTALGGLVSLCLSDLACVTIVGQRYRKLTRFFELIDCLMADSRHHRHRNSP